MTQNLDGGLTKEDCLEIARVHEESGLLDFLNLNFGRVDTEIDYGNLMPGMWAPMAPYLHLVEEFRRELTLPVFHACRINDAATARHAIREGIVDMVGMTRAHISDPHIVEKIAAGQEDRIRPCVGAAYCMDHRLCIHTPSTGREETLPHQVTAADTRRRVVVVGGGPGGPRGCTRVRPARPRGHSSRGARPSRRAGCAGRQGGLATRPAGRYQLARRRSPSPGCGCATLGLCRTGDPYWAWTRTSS